MSEGRKPFRASEGWLRMTLTMTSKKPLSENEIKKIAAMGKPDEYQWGQVEQYGDKIKVIMRPVGKADLGDFPWCAECQSWHAKPRDRAHWLELKCFAPCPFPETEPSAP